MTSYHVIRQQHLHVEVNGAEAEGMALHNKLSGWCQDGLFPALERTLDRCVPSTEFWSLERLDIEVGEVELERVEQDLPRLIVQALEQALRIQSPIKTYPTLTPTISDGIRQQLSQQRSFQQRIEEALVYFLKTGTLPWGLLLQASQNLEQTILTAWLEAPSGRVSDTLLPVLSLANSRKRLVRQFSEVFLAALLERIAPDLKKTIDNMFRQLQRPEISAEAGQTIVKQVWETAFALIPTAAGNYTEAHIIRTAWQQLPVTVTRQSDLAILLENYWPGAIPSPVEIAGKKPSPLQLTGKTNDTSQRVAKQQALRRKKPTDQSLVSARVNSADSFSHRTDDTVPPEDQSKHYSHAKKAVIHYGHTDSNVAEDGQSTQHPDVAEGLYIDNAGLVLLHPFLPQFFKALNITSEDRLVQPERALGLLHYLTTGQLVAPEYELVLPKVLCNIPLSAPVESDLGLTALETEESIALLAAVIRHWAVLKNTGVDGLRGTFLLRSGKISLLDDGNWRLQIESKAYDILLNQLPWGVGMVKLPWMERMLWVEWQY